MRSRSSTIQKTHNPRNISNGGKFSIWRGMITCILPCKLPFYRGLGDGFVPSLCLSHGITNLQRYPVLIHVFLLCGILLIYPTWISIIPWFWIASSPALVLLLPLLHFSIHNRFLPSLASLVRAHAFAQLENIASRARVSPNAMDFGQVARPKINLWLVKQSSQTQTCLPAKKHVSSIALFSSHCLVCTLIEMI